MLFKMEFDQLLTNVYEEDQFELNERVNVKKILLLFVTLALYQSVEGFTDIRNYLELWKK